MPEPMPRAETIAALGCVAHSGWAVMVGVSLVGARPLVLSRERLEMMDPRDPASKQPYHTVEGLPVEEAAIRLARYAATAERMATDGVRRIVDRFVGDGHLAIGLGIIDSAGRRGASLEATLRSHALIHAADGDHYRDALSRAAARLDLPVL